MFEQDKWKQLDIGLGGEAPRQIIEMLAGLVSETHLPPRPNAPAHSAIAGNQISDQPNHAARYRTLVEQIPAIVFMAYLDRGISEAYVSPHIEAMLGFTQEEWLEDP